MSLTIGSRLGHYDVTALIGEGGMGQVYRATDTQLGRDVALKILPDAFAADPDRLARFQREAQVLASLNHPGIAAIYGIEKSDDTQALVLELVEGPTLADRIAKGPIPLDEALPIAKQIAEALEAAHEAGVIHRDLKPANIKVREDGTVKVLDFGLAKALDTAPGGDPSQSPTLTAAATQMGVILGTAAYMSPEQARGKPVDKRSDIWAFGCVLYEMLTGRRAFESEDVSLTLADVMRAEPAWGRLPDRLSPALDVYLKRCLQKDPRQRVRDIGDVRLALEGAFELAEPKSTEIRPERSSTGWGFAAAFVAGSVLCGVAVWTLLGAREPRPGVTTRFPISLPPGDVVGAGDSIAMSPDGTKTVYSATRAGVRQLFLRARDRLDPVALPGTDDANAPFFSPNGASVGFSVDGVLKRLSVPGGMPTTICDCDAGSAVWRPDGTIVFASYRSSGLMQVPALGGAPEPLTTPELEGDQHLLPFALADGALLLTRERSGGRYVGVFSPATGEVQPLFEGTAPRLVGATHLVFVRDRSLWVVPFDTSSHKTLGEPAPMVEGILTNLRGAGQYATGEDGSLVYLPTRDQANRTMVRVDRQGVEKPLSGLNPSQYGPLSVSRDGEKLAFRMARAGEPPDVWTYDFERGVPRPLTTHPANDSLPLWAPDNRRIVFHSLREGPGLFWQPIDGLSVAERLVGEGGFMTPRGWSADGLTLVYERIRPGYGDDILTLSLADSQTRQLLATEFDERFASVSRDGELIAYSSNQSGRFEIWIARFSDPHDAVRVTLTGGSAPVWSVDGRELFYRSLDGARVFAVPIDRDPVLQPAGQPLKLFEGDYALPEGIRWRTYDVLPDGGFVMVKQLPPPVATDSRPDIIFVTNWIEELRARVPIP